MAFLRVQKYAFHESEVCVQSKSLFMRRILSTKLCGRAVSHALSIPSWIKGAIGSSKTSISSGILIPNFLGGNKVYSTESLLGC